MYVYIYIYCVCAVLCIQSHGNYKFNCRLLHSSASWRRKKTKMHKLPLLLPSRWRLIPAAEWRFVLVWLEYTHLLMSSSVACFACLCVCVFFFFVFALQWCTISHSRADKIVSKNPPDSNRDCERLLSVGAELQRRGIVSRKNQKYFSWLVSKFLSVVTEYYNELLIIFQDLLQQLCLVTICVTDRSEAFIVVCLRIRPHQRDHINIIQHKRLFVQFLCDWDESDNDTWILPSAL